MAQPDLAYRTTLVGRDAWKASRSSAAHGPSYQNGPQEAVSGLYRPASVTYSTGPVAAYSNSASSQYGQANASTVTAPGFSPVSSTPTFGNGDQMYGPYQVTNGQTWESPGRYSPADSLEDIFGSPRLSDEHFDHAAGSSMSGKHKSQGTHRSQRRPSNRDEFDGPHQLLRPPPADYIAMQERELPHLPTNLLVQEQDSVLTRVNDRLSQCAYDFVAKYQFPIPLTQDMRPVERPQDREWTEWVYLLKRLATKRRIPARVLYNGQIKQFVTILENSLEMRHAAKHQSRPLKDDRNILQLISAGIQVAKILKDAQAMDYLDRLYVSTEQQIQERAAAAAARFRN